MKSDFVTRFLSNMCRLNRKTNDHTTNKTLFVG